MRIKHKAQFILGIFDVLLGIVSIILSVFQHIPGKSVLPGLVFAYGIALIFDSIETKAQRQKCKEELQEMAKVYGWREDNEQSKERE